jgi:membrane fusion protein, multidrug efflux system
MRRIFIIIATVVVSLSACKQDKKAELSKLKKEEAALKEKIEALEKEVGVEKPVIKRKVIVKPVTTAMFTHSIDVQGKVDGDQSVNVSCEVPGVIMRVNVEPGSSVKKGQILAEQDNKVLAQSIAELQSAREYANTMYLKQKSLWDQKIGTEVQFLSAKNQLESLDRKLATVNQQLEMTRVKSPIDGTVDQVNIKVGQTMVPGIPCFAVVNTTKLKVKAELAESYASKVKKGDDIIIKFPDLGSEIKTKVSYSGKIINPLNRTFNIEAQLGSSEEIRPNMIALIRLIDYQNEHAITVPSSIIQRSGEEEFVYVAEPAGGNTTVKKRVVKTGRAYNGMVEIVSGLNEGEKLIVTGYQEVNPGDLITI